MTKAPDGAEQIFCRSYRSFGFGRTKTHGFTVGYYRSPLRGSLQNVPRNDICAERAGWSFANFFDGIKAALRTTRNLTCAIQFYVGSQVIGKVNGFTVSFFML